ncbi:MAG: septal ring lytic transglycosylase RlpA family protein [Holosporales bacterium]|nr:septal ring lytic transglycosylase RlpA family protein [Holosporales bacterium]
MSGLLGGVKAQGAPRATKVKISHTGTASWYGEHWRGRRTASGIPFDPKALVAAHPTLPLLSKVRVTNMLNGRSVEVPVVDRMPRKWKRRVIDLSQGAAQSLGFVKRGLAPVRVEVLSHLSLHVVPPSLRKTSHKKTKHLRKAKARAQNC